MGKGGESVASESDLTRPTHTRLYNQSVFLHYGQPRLRITPSRLSPITTSIRPVISEQLRIYSNRDNTRRTVMKPWLHFTGGDYLYFKSCQPASNGAIAGACIALVCLALLERFTVAFRSVMEARWRHSTLATPKNHSTPSEQHYDRGGSCDNDAIQLPQQPRSTCPSRRQSSQRLIAPFILAHDIQRGGMYAIQALLGYALMLAAMTFQAAYLMSIILGLGIGEVMFRRMESVITYALH